MKTISKTDIEFGNHALDLIKEGGETTDHVIIWALDRVLNAYYKIHPKLPKSKFAACAKTRA